MQDLLLTQDADGLFDLAIDGADFESVDGFGTAITTSFFTDSRASAVQVQDASRRRGWVGNILYADIERELGGELWLLEQSRLTSDTLNFAKQYCEGSLQWMLDDRIARQIFVEVKQTSTRAITIYTTITTIDNTVQRYVTLWRLTDLTRI